MKVIVNRDLFLYDIKALIRTFCLGEKIDLLVSEDVFLRKGTYPWEQWSTWSEKMPDGTAEHGAVDQKVCLFLWMEELSSGAEGQITACLFNEKGGLLGEMEKNGTPNDRRAYKNQIKRVIFQLFEEVYCKGDKVEEEYRIAKVPAWGILTGVRPTKLPMEYLNMGWRDEEIFSFLKEEYLCSDEKLSLALSIAKTEKKLLEPVDLRDGYSLYIGIPFCPTTCHYCSFASFSMERFASMVPDYLKALHKEIRDTADLMKGRKLTCVYFGGGTPTTLSAEQLKELILHVKEAFPMEDMLEFTVEAGRPDTITEEKLRVLWECGVTRISINPQTMQQKTLDLVGRNHSTEQIRRSMEMARALGFDNINMDLIVGLPGEGVEDVRDTLEQIKEMKPDSLTVHSMVLKRAAKLNLMMTVRETTDADIMEDMVELGMQYAKEMGLFPYYMYRQKNAQGSRNQSRDNIGYAAPGKEGLYNIIIMEELQSILALGAGATTKFTDSKTGRIERADNVKSIKDYIERIEEMTERKKMVLEAMGQ